MDPNACFDRWKFAVARGDADEARDAADDLLGWLARGGFEPKWTPEMRAHFMTYVSAWSGLLPEYRSEHIGWSKAGEFYCPHCPTIIGKNLRDERPFLLASQHLSRKHPETKR